MKKIAVLLLTACLTAAVLSGCSPKNTETMTSAENALSEGDFENALVQYEQAVDEGQQLQACYRGMGIALMGKMEYEAAAEAFQKDATGQPTLTSSASPLAALANYPLAYEKPTGADRISFIGRLP